MTKKASGQSLIELLLAIVLGVMFITAASGVLAVSLRSSSQNKSLRIASLLTQELLEKTRVFSEQKWHNVYYLTRGQPYYLISGVGGFSAVSGTEILNVDGTNYGRSFQVSNFTRSGIDDPATQIIQATVVWQQGASNASLSRSQYVTRKRNFVWFSDSPGNGNESAVFDSGVSGGPAWNTAMWQGGGGIVGFRIATDVEGDGPWNYLGPNGNPAAYYQPAGPNSQIKITAADHNNKRYLRYRLYHLSGSPQVNRVIINYSP